MAQAGSISWYLHSMCDATDILWIIVLNRMCKFLTLDNIVRTRLAAALWFNSLWPSDAIWRHRSMSTLAQVMACCLTSPSHYLNQCWLMISEVLQHSPDGNFTENTSHICEASSSSHRSDCLIIGRTWGVYVDENLSHDVWGKILLCILCSDPCTGGNEIYRIAWFNFN